MRIQKGLLVAIGLLFFKEYLENQAQLVLLVHESCNGPFIPVWFITWPHMKRRELSTILCINQLVLTP